MATEPHNLLTFYIFVVIYLLFTYFFDFILKERSIITWKEAHVNISFKVFLFSFRDEMLMFYQNKVKKRGFFSKEC